MTEQEQSTKIHETYSVKCFNSAWDLIDKSERTLAEEEEMLRLSMAALWHWTQRPDCKDQNRSIGYWQISRIHALAGRADEARRYGELCLAASSGDEIAPFALAYAFEALARAESVAGNADERDRYLSEARRVVATMTDADTIKMLEDDLSSIA